MGLKELKTERKELKDWRKELDKIGLDSVNLITINHVRNHIMRELKDKDDTKHNTMITFLQANQTLVNNSILTQRPGLQQFIDNIE